MCIRDRYDTRCKLNRHVINTIRSVENVVERETYLFVCKYTIGYSLRHNYLFTRNLMEDRGKTLEDNAVFFVVLEGKQEK